MHLQAHHQFFPQGINRRIGDLGEALLEVVVKQVRLMGKHRQGDVVSHAVGGLLALACHVLDHQIQVLGAEAKGSLLLEQIEVAQLLLLGPRERRQLTALLRQPGPIGMAGRHLLLHLPVAQQATLFQIHGQHLART